ncbi:MAG: hypothetical protein JWO04_1062 [Gammaproteobacteria bacterium]|nr:hypothetical protein [Gammaproteobacteria bacterium]
MPGQNCHLAAFAALGHRGGHDAARVRHVCRTGGAARHSATHASHGATMSGHALNRGAKRLRYGGVRHRAAPFVLAMLCLRAFVPAGFMLAPVDGRLEVVLCDTDAPGATPGTSPTKTHGHYALGHHAHDHAAGHHHAQTDPTCPYAQSSGPAPLPVLPVLAAVQLATLSAAPIQVAQTHSRFGPTRQQSPRGPPRLA